GRERDLVATLRARAKLESSLEAKRDLLKDAKRLAEGVVGDRDLAEAVLRDLLADDEANMWALEELTRLREAAGDADEVVRMLLRRAELETDGAQRSAHKHTAATVLAEQLKDAPRAIALYEEILDQDGSDKTAASRLRVLYSEEGREKELAKLLQTLI